MMFPRAGRKGRRRLGMNVGVGSSSCVRSITLGVGRGSVLALLGDEERSTASAFRLFDGRGPKATLLVPVAGVPVAGVPVAGMLAGCFLRLIELMFLMSCLALTTNAGTDGVPTLSR